MAMFHLTVVVLMMSGLHLASCKAPLYKAWPENKILERYIVMLKDGIDVDYACSAIEKETKGEFSETNILHVYRTFHAFSVHVSHQLMAKLLDCDVVAYIEEDQTVKALDTDYEDTVSPLLASWGLDRVDQRDLPLNNGTRQYLGNYGTGVHVYIMDTGVDYSHPDFADRTGDGYDAVKLTSNSSVGEDCHGHGTHCAGTAVGSTFGVAINATVHDVTVLGCSGSSATAIVLEGYEWIAENHTRPAVASVSLGGRMISQAHNDAVKMMFDSGVVVVTAAGNENIDACEYFPGSAPEAINVGAVDIEDTRAYFSNFGRCVDIFAPGIDIPSANYMNHTEPGVRSGTSMACPHVSGAAAILLSIDLTLTPQNVTDLILRGATRNKVVDKRFLSPDRLLYIGVETCVTGCGFISDDRVCQCDIECTSRGDCCHDYTYLCWDNAPTCSGRCEETAQEPMYPCQCDDGCYSREDCCDDYAILCRPIDLPCDSTHEQLGIYYSPYYPDNYLANQTCRTIIRLPEHLRETSGLLIYITDFELEDSIDCSQDSLTFYDGESEDSPALGRYCGNISSGLITGDVIIGGNAITAVFKTNENGSGRGYTYYVQETTRVPQRYFVQTPGVIMSKNFTYSNYSNDEITITKIYAPPGEHVLVNVTHFDVEGADQNNCYDSLAFYDDYGSADYLTPSGNNLIGQHLCSLVVEKNPSFSPLKSRGSSIFVVFQTDSSVTKTGYSALATSVKSCDVTVTRPGTISSSTYPSQYYNNEQCFTKIRAPRGKQVVITFSDFQLQEPENGGCYDYLIAYNGFEPVEDNLIDLFCGTNAPQIRSMGRNLLLQFESDILYTSRGYKADVTFDRAVTAKLYGGKARTEGRVEITHSKYGKGSLCDDNWDVLDGHVVCKMLGYQAAKDAPRRAYFEQGNGCIMLSDLDCSGAEYNVDDCPHSGWRPRTCGRRQEASVICYEKGEVPLPVRLIDGDAYNAGRVELRIGDKWGTVCGNGWDEKEAEVFCRSAGFDLGVEKVLGVGDVVPGNSSQPIFFNGVKCSGDESRLEFCLHSGVGNHDCDHSQDVGVECRIPVPMPTQH